MVEAQGDSVEAIVRDAAQRLVEVVRGRPDFMNLMFIELVEFQSAHARSLANNLLPMGLQVAQRLLSVEPKRIRPIPPAMLVRSFLGLFFAYTFTEAILAPAMPQASPEETMRRFVDIYLYGILLPPSEGDLP